MSITATIAASGTTSNAVDLNGRTLCGIFVPAAFTGTALTFLASPDGSTYVAVKDGAGNSVSLTVAQGQYIPVDATKLRGVRFLKIVSGSTEGAERVLTLVTRGGGF